MNVLHDNCRQCYRVRGPYGWQSVKFFSLQERVKLSPLVLGTRGTNVRQSLMIKMVIDTQSEMREYCYPRKTFPRTTTFITNPLQTAMGFDQSL